MHSQRTAREYALFLRQLAAQHPNALKIRLVQDNLSIHDISALYETFDSKEAFELSQRFEFFFTPNSASWLNMLARRCLHRRIPTMEQIEREILALVQQRERNVILINWQFAVKKARDTFHSQYQSIRKNEDII